jgi:hypothetical protein
MEKVQVCQKFSWSVSSHSFSPKLELQYPLWIMDFWLLGIYLTWHLRAKKKKVILTSGANQILP